MKKQFVNRGSMVLGLSLAFAVGIFVVGAGLYFLGFPFGKLISGAVFKPPEETVVPKSVFTDDHSTVVSSTTTTEEGEINKNLQEVAPVVTKKVPVQETPIREVKGIKIVSPLNGSVVPSGSTVLVRVEGTGGLSRVSGLFAAPSFFGAGEFSSLPFEKRITTPKELYGEIGMMVLAQDLATGMLYSSKEVTLFVKPSAHLTGDLEFTGGLCEKPSGLSPAEAAEYPHFSIFGAEGESLLSGVRGLFSDGIWRDISATSTGTTYTTTDPGFIEFKIHPQGAGALVGVVLTETGRKGGVATIIAKNSGFFTLCNVSYDPSKAY